MDVEALLREELHDDRHAVGYDAELLDRVEAGASRRRTKRRRVAAAAATVTVGAVVVAAAALSPDPARRQAPDRAVPSPAQVTGPTTARPRTVGEFLDLWRFYEVDYEPLKSPRDAIAKSDLIVSGRLVTVTDGTPDAEMSTTGRSLHRDAVMVFEVDRVLTGDRSLIRGGRVEVRLDRKPDLTVAELAARVPEARAVLVLTRSDDRTTANGSPVFESYADGMWLQGPDDARMDAILVEPRELRPAWQGVDTIDEWAALFD